MDFNTKGIRENKNEKMGTYFGGLFVDRRMSFNVVKLKAKELWAFRNKREKECTIHIHL